MSLTTAGILEKTTDTKHLTLPLEVRAGVYVGSCSVKVRKRLWKAVTEQLEDGSALMAWSTCNESGFEFSTAGKNRREPVNIDGLSQVQFLPSEQLEKQPDESADFQEGHNILIL